MITISFYRAVDRFSDSKATLVPDGILFVQHHLRTTAESSVGPQGDRYRFASNEMLRACLNLTVLFYAELTEDRTDGRTATTAQIVARNSTGQHQSYPHLSLGD